MHACRPQELLEGCVLSGSSTRTTLPDVSTARQFLRPLSTMKILQVSCPIFAVHFDIETSWIYVSRSKKKVHRDEVEEERRTKRLTGDIMEYGWMCQLNTECIIYNILYTQIPANLNVYLEIAREYFSVQYSLRVLIYGAIKFRQNILSY